MTTLVVIAKQPLPGRAKTRLHPPLSLEEAAELAACAIDDTLDSLSAVPATRRILLFDGVADRPLMDGWEVIPQVSGGLDERLGALFDACDGPTVLVGMDTPQVSPDHLRPIFSAWPDEIDAWIGPASDGGFWALAMREPRGDLIRGVAMSQDDTGMRQRLRLDEAGLRVGTLQTLDDVDTMDDALRVAAIAPWTRFAARVRSVVA